MSKAFTKDDAPIWEPQPVISNELRYITPDGHATLTSALRTLLEVERPRLATAAAAAADPVAAATLRDLDKRIHALARRVELSQVLAPPLQDGGRVYFGAEVIVEDDAGQRTTFRIVGPDEIDLTRRWVSHASPVGRALLGKSVGDVVTVLRPKGELDYEIVAVQPHVPTR